MKALVVSHPFWVAVLTIVVLVVGLFFPGYGLDVEHAAGLAVIAGGYMVAYAINPTGGGLKDLLQSRKFWTSILGFAVILGDSFHIFPTPLDLTAIVGFVMVIIVYTFMLAKDPGNGWRGLIISRKFWAALLGLALSLLKSFNVYLPEGVSEESILSMTVIVCGFIAGIGISGPPTPLPDPEIPDDTKMLKG